MSTADRRILATYLLDNLDAAIETLPPECRPGANDPSECAHAGEVAVGAGSGKRWCVECGAGLQTYGGTE